MVKENKLRGSIVSNLPPEWELSPAFWDEENNEGACFVATDGNGRMVVADTAWECVQAARAMTKVRPEGAKQIQYNKARLLARKKRKRVLTTE